jgi:hypothetical protein
MRYLCLLVAEPGIELPPPGSVEFGQVMEDFQTSTKAMNDAGVVISTGPLDPPENARTLRLRDGQRVIRDGPFAEIKEVIGGYYVLDCEDMDEALRWAATIPSARYGAIEVRPLMRMPGHE